MWRGADKLGGPFGAATKLLILTGQRRDEVLRMTWDEVDLVGRVWNLPGERVKNGSAHAVPLADPAVEILRGHGRSRVGPSSPVLNSFKGQAAAGRGDRPDGGVAAARYSPNRQTGLAKAAWPCR